MDNSKDTKDVTQEERRSDKRLSDEELDEIAKRAADIVWKNFTMQVGKTAINLFLYICGAIVLAGLAYFGINQKMK